MINLEFKGLDAALRDVVKLVKDTEDRAQRAIDDFGTKVEGDAKRLAPADERRLGSSINADSGRLQTTITVATNYAAFMEFGTRKFAAQYVATLPPDWQSYAASFKGQKGGSFDEFIKSLVAWVKRKGIGKTYNVSTRRADRVGKQSAATTAEADAYGIALYILRNGVRPHPFLYPAVKKHTPELIDEMKKILNG